MKLNWTQSFTVHLYSKSHPMGWKHNIYLSNVIGKVLKHEFILFTAKNTLIIKAYVTQNKEINNNFQHKNLLTHSMVLPSKKNISIESRFKLQIRDFGGKNIYHCDKSWSIPIKQEIINLFNNNRTSEPTKRKWIVLS